MIPTAVYSQVIWIARNISSNAWLRAEHLFVNVNIHMWCILLANLWSRILLGLRLQVRAKVSYTVSCLLLPYLSLSYGSLQFGWANTAGDILQRYGGSKPHELGKELVHSPKNAFTASLASHKQFDSLEFWMTPIKVCPSSPLFTTV